MTAWTEDRVEQLKGLLTSDMSAKEISCALGSVTRNAVISKVFRLGLKLPGSHKTPSERAISRARPRRTPRVSRPAYRSNLAYAEPEPLPTEECAVTPISQRRSLMELTSATCKWPIFGEGLNTVFCGGLTYPDRPYCAGHCRMAYTPPRPKSSVTLLPVERVMKKLYGPDDPPVREYEPQAEPVYPTTKQRAIA